MKGYKLLIFLVLFIGFLIYIQPDTDGAVNVANDFLRQIENGQWPNALANMLIVPNETARVLPKIGTDRLNAQWIADIFHDGKWGSASRLLGVVEAQRLAAVFRLPVSRFKAMASRHGYLVFTKAKKGQWQLLSCRCNLLGNFTRPDRDTPLLLGYENGIALVERHGRMTRLAIADFAQIASNRYRPKTEPKPEPKTEPKPEPKTEPKPEPKTEPKPEPKTEPKPEPKTEPKPEPKTEPKPEPKTEPKPEPKTEPKPEPKTEPKPEPKTEPKLEPKTEPKPQPKTEPKPQPKTEPKPQPKTEPKPQPKTEPKPEPKAEPKPEPKAEPKPEPKTEPKPEPKAEPKPEPKTEPKPEPKTEPKPLPRALVFGFHSQKDPREKLLPEVVKLNDKPVNSGDSVTPGNYRLYASKAGYRDIDRAISIKAGRDPYVLNFAFELHQILVTFLFQDEKSQQPIQPDRAWLDKRPLGKGKVRLLPGQYNLQAEKKDYSPLQQKVSVLEGKDSCDITLSMTPLVSRDVIVSIDYAMLPGEMAPVAVMLISLKTGKKQKIDRQTKLVPGKYKLQIQRNGYQPIEEEITVPPGQGAYYLQRTLQPAPRKLIIAITADYPPGAKIQPDEIVFSGKPLTGAVVKPGRYTLEILKNGYQGLTERVHIRPSQQPFLVVRTLSVLPRPVQLQIVDKQSKEQLTAQNVRIDGKKISLRGLFELRPQRYQVEIWVKGYQNFQDTISVPPGSGPHSIRIEMIKQK